MKGATRKVFDGSQYFACGAEVRFEKFQEEKDDSGMNGIRLTFCNTYDWDLQEVVAPEEGYWGEWMGMKLCPQEQFITSMDLRVEPYQGKGFKDKGTDDTAANGV